MSPAAKRALELLSKHTALAWPILKAQCELAGHDPSVLQLVDLADVAPRLVRALGKFTSPLKAQAFERELLALSRSSTATRPTEPRAAPAEERELRGLARRAHDVLLASTPLARPLLETQCARAGLDPIHLSRAELRQLIPALLDGLRRFGPKVDIAHVREQLEALT